MTKEVKEFSKNRRHPDGLQTYCKTCSAAHNKKYYQEHAKAMRRASGSAQSKRKKKIKKWLRGYLETCECTDCGTTDVRVLEFDHVRGVKDKEISRLVNDGYSRQRLYKEIAKCDVVCANCHRIRTYARSGGNYRTV